MGYDYNHRSYDLGTNSALDSYVNIALGNAYGTSLFIIIPCNT